MYAALWRVLPGPTWVRVAQLVGLVVVLAVVLMAFVFPFIADVFLTEESTVGN